LPQEALSYIDEYIAASAEEDSAKARKQAAANHLKELLGNHEKGQVEGHTIGECTLVRHLAESGIYALHSVRRIHNLTNCASIIIQLRYMVPVAYPDVHRTRISAPGLLKTFKLAFRRLQTWGSVNLLEMVGKRFVLLTRHIFQAVADQMHYYSIAQLAMNKLPI